MGEENVFVGYAAGGSSGNATIAEQNTFIGAWAGSDNNKGGESEYFYWPRCWIGATRAVHDNVFIGYAAGRDQSS